MSLTAQDIDRIANLARLELPPEEGQRMLDQINGFFTVAHTQIRMPKQRIIVFIESFQKTSFVVFRYVD